MAPKMWDWAKFPPPPLRKNSISNPLFLLGGIPYTTGCIVCCPLKSYSINAIGVYKSSIAELSSLHSISTARLREPPLVSLLSWSRGGLVNDKHCSTNAQKDWRGPNPNIWLSRFVSSCCPFFSRFPARSSYLTMWSCGCALISQNEGSVWNVPLSVPDIDTFCFI